MAVWVVVDGAEGVGRWGEGREEDGERTWNGQGEGGESTGNGLGEGGERAGRW